jgi:asparagine synthetase B (glutamine-hydrolysing)
MMFLASISSRASRGGSILRASSARAMASSWRLQEVLRRDSARPHDFATLTFVWDETPQSDERRWSDPVVREHDLVNHRLRGDDQFFDGAHEASLYRNEPHFGLLCHPMVRAEAELLRNARVEVLLSGSRAEPVVLPDLTPPVHLADHLRHLRLQAFVRELLRWQRGTHQPLLNLFLRFALQPLLKPHRSFGSSEEAPALSPWVDKSFARRMRLQDRVQAARAEKRFHSIAQQLQYERLCRSEQMVHRGFSEWSCEVRYPFLYRPLVEFVLALPWEQKVSPREGKLLLRRSLAGRLPEVVRTRQGGAGPGPSMYKAYARRWATIEPVVRSSLLVSMGFLDRAEFLPCSRARPLRHVAEVWRLSLLPCPGALAARRHQRGEPGRRLERSRHWRRVRP